MFPPPDRSLEELVPLEAELHLMFNAAAASGEKGECGRVNLSRTLMSAEREAWDASHNSCL